MVDGHECHFLQEGTVVHLLEVFFQGQGCEFFSVVGFVDADGL